MAIQTINLTVPGGDTPRSANTKINENFSNTTHAASRLVGASSGRVPEMVGTTGVAGLGLGGTSFKVIAPDFNFLVDELVNGTYGVNANYTDLTYLPFEKNDYANITVLNASGGDRTVFWSSRISLRQRFAARTIQSRATPQLRNLGEWAEFYTTVNTTKDTATGFLKASSPVLHVYNDSITKIHEANQLDITVDKKGVGHYEIHGTTGLRKNDGWFMSPPRDVHGNVLCMVDLEEKDGAVILRTYKKKFDFETVSIVHDWDSPMDIPDGVCVEFRFNDIPKEQLDEPIE